MYDYPDLQTNCNAALIPRKININDIDTLVDYLNNLGPATRSRFAPHPFSKQELLDFYQKNSGVTGYGLWDPIIQQWVAYSVVRTGYFDYEFERMCGYGITLNRQTDAMYAPSVADACQGKGLAGSLFHWVLGTLKKKGTCRIFLWGGVQASNIPAIKFYTKSGFKIIGQFEYDGLNLEMQYNIANAS